MIIIEYFSFQWIHWKIHIGKKLDCLKQICLNDSNQTTELSTYKAPETAYLCQFTLISCCFRNTFCVRVSLIDWMELIHIFTFGLKITTLACNDLCNRRKNGTFSFCVLESKEQVPFTAHCDWKQISWYHNLMEVVYIPITNCWISISVYSTGPSFVQFIDFSLLCFS